MLNSSVEYLWVLLFLLEAGDDYIDKRVLSYVDEHSFPKSLQPDMDGDAIFQVISMEMTHWLKILQVTGGDLALQKCHLTLLKWKWGPILVNPH